jgi:citrate synthase
MKERFLNFAIKHRKVWAITNISLAVAGGMMAFTGAGLPVAGALEATRRSIGSVMMGVTVRESVRGLKEDADIKLGKIKWQAAIPKLVGESLQEGYIKGAKIDDLSTKLSTLEAYYRLNGGKFTNESQQTAYEAILTELGQRVENQTNNQTSPDVEQPEEREPTAITGLDYNMNLKDNPIEKNPNYVSNLLEVVSEKRITELQRLQRNSWYRL